MSQTQFTHSPSPVRRQSQWLRAVALVSFLMTASCSRLDLALRWADTFVMSSVTDYFELNSEQKKYARNEFNTALSELRSQDFPKLSALLREIALLSENNQLQSENVTKALKDLQTGALLSIQRFEPMAQKVVADQVPKQFRMFDEEFQKKYEKDLKKAQDPTQARARLKDRTETIIDESIEFLTPSQKTRLKEWQAQTTPPQIPQIESRKHVFEKFKLARIDEKTRIQFVSTFFKDWESLQTPEYLKVRAEYQTKIQELVIAIATSLDEKQRKNLTENLRSRADEFEKLARQ